MHHNATIDPEPDQEALFDIEGPDERGCVWIHARSGDPWSQNLGPCRKVAEVLSQWLGSVEYDEVETDQTNGRSVPAPER